MRFLLRLGKIRNCESHADSLAIPLIPAQYVKGIVIAIPCESELSRH